MYYTCCVLIQLTILTSVVGIINVNYIDKNEKERKLTDLEGNINHTLNILERNILDRLITYIDGKVKASNKKTEENLEEKIKQLSNASNKNIETLDEKLTQTLNASNKKIEWNLEEKITQFMNASNKKLEESFNEKITETLNASNQKMEHKLEAKTTETLNALDKMKKELVENIRISVQQMLPCKEKLVSHSGVTAIYSMDDETLNHVTLKKDSTGRLTYFEMHFAIIGDQHVLIWLLNKDNFSKSDKVYDIEIGRDSNQYTRLNFWYDESNWKTIKLIYTPNILSSAQFRAFYVKIDGGKLTFGKEGSSSPLITHYGSHLADVNYFMFRSYATNEAWIRLDCPVQGASYSLSGLMETNMGAYNCHIVFPTEQKMIKTYRVRVFVNSFNPPACLRPTKSCRLQYITVLDG